jgi:hypothetical protein
VSELVDDKAKDWRLKLTHACESTFIINKDDIVYELIEGIDSNSQTYRTTCPACGLDHHIPYAQLPGWVQQYAMRKSH